MSIRPGMSIVDVAFEVGTVLADADIVAVLSGGGAAATYAPEAYQTQDLDFILQSVRAKVDPVLSLGFLPRGRSAMYEHPDIPFTLEFPAGPLAVGDDLITEWNKLHDGERQLNILSPTDCVRDRLAAAIHWKDEKSITQAVAVAKGHPVDRALIEAWCAREGGGDVYREFVRRLSS